MSDLRSPLSCDVDRRDPQRPVYVCAVILVADIVIYDRLAGAGEDRTLARLRTLRSVLIDPTNAVHHGRIVQPTGDGSLIEFRSVVDAARCAIEVQNGLVERKRRPAAGPPHRVPRRYSSW